MLKYIHSVRQYKIKTCVRTPVVAHIITLAQKRSIWWAEMTQMSQLAEYCSRGNGEKYRAPEWRMERANY
jgi:hypothetical protein